MAQVRRELDALGRARGQRVPRRSSFRSEILGDEWSLVVEQADEKSFHLAFEAAGRISPALPSMARIADRVV